MKLYSNKKILAITAVLICSANSVFATSSYKGNYRSGCNYTNGSSPDNSVCDTWEGSEIYDLYNNGTNIQYGTETSAGSVVVDGVSIRVSGWADTANASGASDTIVDQNNQAFPFYWNGEDGGMGMLNNDENYSDSSWSHAIDNLSGHTTDYDMVLFSFSEEVSLAGATFSWLGGAVSSQQLTVVGLNSISGLTSGSPTWESIAGSSAVVSAGSFQIEKCDDVYVSDFTSSETAQYWLVGAYNTAFGYVNGFSKNDDEFKLASLGFSKAKTPETGEKPPTDVNAPGSFALLVLGGGFMAWRRRKNV